MFWDILRYAAFGLFLLVLLPYTVIALWGIGAWSKALVQSEAPDTQHGAPLADDGDGSSADPASTAIK